MRRYPKALFGHRGDIRPDTPTGRGSLRPNDSNQLPRPHGYELERGPTSGVDARSYLLLNNNTPVAVSAVNKMGKAVSAVFRIFSGYLWRWPLQSLLLTIQAGVTQPGPFEAVFHIKPQPAEPLCLEFDDVTVHEA